VNEPNEPVRDRCPLCGAPDAQPVRTVGAYQVVRCRGCDLQRAQPLPTSADLAAYYQNEAYFDGDVQGYADYAAMEKVLRPLAERRLRRIEAWSGRAGRVLDFGCAGGFFLDEARKRGWEIAGAELSRPMAERTAALLGIPIAADLAELADRSGTFDGVTLWEVIEHLPDPLPELARLRSLLKPGGWLALSTPNTGHWQALAAPNEWTSYCPPAHVLYLTEHTLRRLLGRAGVGDVRIWRSGPRPRLPGWLNHWTRSLQQGVADGTAMPWRLSLVAWRAIRLGALLANRLSAGVGDGYMTLEAFGVCP
jgi:2-polyprenyl-3-methyl-5-hydroxy-6-metoxy-1,4-benzoquinol methylase